MPERHNIVQENATPTGASAFVSSELPTVESIFTRSRNLRGKASRSSSSLRVILSALASVAAIVILVFSCSHAYNRRAVQDYRTRRLANSEDSDAAVDLCGEFGGEEEQPQRERPRLPSLPSGDGRGMPHKKRLLERVAAGATGGSAHERQQEGKQHSLSGAAKFQSGLHAPETLPKQEKPGPPALLVGSPLSSAQKRAQGELDAAAGLLTLIPRHYDVANLASGARQTASSEVQQLRQQVRQMERKVQRERSSMQRQLRRLQQQLKSERRRRQQLQAQMQQVRDGQSQQQHLPWHYLLWHQQQQLLRQQQQQQQYLLQQQAHLPQRPLHQPQPPPLLQHDQEKRQRLMQQQEQHVMPVEEGTRQHTQRKRRREEQGELQPREEEQHRPRQHGNQHPGHLVEDEWLEPELPIAQAPQPSTSQQALQHSTAGAAARRSTSEDRRTHVTPLQVAIQLIPVLSSAPVVSISAAAAGAQRDDAPVGPPVGAVTSNAGVALVLAAAEPKFAAPVTTGKAVKLKPRTVSGLQNHGSGKSNGTAAAGTAAAGSAIAASGSTSASTTPTDDSDSVPDDIREHPFVHLPQRLASTTTETVLVDLRRAVTACPGRLDLIPLLQEARDVLSRRFLCLEMQKKLAHLAGALIEHAMNHQHQDLSKVRTTRALVRLALRFLLMDVVVSAFVVLDQTPDGDFWKRFTDTVSHSPPLGPSQGSGEGRTTFALCLARELSKAIVTLKTGVRPKPEDLMRIKHMLFCSPSSPSRFRRPDFDGWRQDSCERIDEQ